jgi:hypothetical protein
MQKLGPFVITILHLHDGGHAHDSDCTASRSSESLRRRMVEIVHDVSRMPAPSRT